MSNPWWSLLDVGGQVPASTLQPQAFSSPSRAPQALVPQTTGAGRPLLQPAGRDLFPQALLPMATEIFDCGFGVCLMMGKWLSCILNFFFLIFQNSFSFTTKLKVNQRAFSYTPCPKMWKAPLLLTSPTGVAALLQLMNLCDTSQLYKVHSLHQGSLLVVYICGFGQMYPPFCVSYRIVSRPPKPYVLCLFNSPYPKPLATTHLFYCLHSFAFSRMLYSWNHTVCNLLRLVFFFTQ